MKDLLLILLLVAVIGVNCDEVFSRNLSATLNPGCEDQNLCNHVTFVHIRAESDSDVLHYLWDFTGVPSILMALTSKNATFTIDWMNYLRNQDYSLKFSEEPQYVFTTTINKIYSFYDPDDNAILKPGFYKNITTYKTHNFTWYRVNFTEESEFVSVEVKTPIGNGTIGLKLTAFSHPNHGSQIPHLLHSPNSTQIDLIIDNVTVGHPNTRFAIQVLLASSDQYNTYLVQKRRNLDDEFTPGIFDIIDVTAAHKNLPNSGYVQYRPVCYLEKERDVSSSTETKYSRMINITNKSEFDNSMIPAYFGNNFDRILTEGFNISFGQSGDEWYDKNKYTSFVFLVGVGEPMQEHLSAFVIATALVGLGIPMVVLTFGGIYLGIKRLRRR